MYEFALATLCTALEESNITYSVSPCYNGFIVRFSAVADVTIHDGTYGSHKGLWESFGFDSDRGDVTGYLDVADVLRKVAELG